MVEKVSTPQPGDTWMLNAGGTSLAATRTGFGAPIVCLHAIGHGAGDFARLPVQLGGQYQVIAIDWPGHGASLPDAMPPTAGRYAELLDGVMDALEASLGISSAYLLGNSIGGTAAIRFAAERPDRVRGLVLCNPGGLQPVKFLARFVCRWMAAFFARGIRGDARFASQFRRYYERDVLSAPEAAWRREEIIATAEQIAPLLTLAWEGFARKDSDLRHLGPKITCPVLFAWAKGDRYIAWSRSKRAARAFPNHQVRLFDGGHAAFLEDPAAFAATLKEFIEASSDTAATISKTSHRRSAG